MKDPMSRAKVFRALITLRRAELEQTEPGPMTLNRLMKKLGQRYEEVKDLVDDLAGWKVVTVEEGHHGQRPYLGIRLTPNGRKAADHAIAAEPYFDFDAEEIEESKD